MKHASGIVFFGLFLLLIAAASSFALESTASRNDGPDQPGEEEELNRELWQSSRLSSYSVALEHVSAARAKSPGPAAEVILPTGWKIAPAGKQVEVGRFPHEAVSYAGRIVVLNAGWYGKAPQEVSVVDPASAETVKLLHVDSLFPSAQPGPGGDLYLSGGYSRLVYRYNGKFALVRSYQLAGYTAGIAAVDADRIAVLYLVAGATPQEYDKGRYGEGKLAILNTVSGEVEREATVGNFPYAVRALKGRLYVTLLGEDKLKVYDLQLRLRTSLSVGHTPQDICADGDRLYVVNTGSDNLSAIDTATDRVAGTISLQSHGTGFGGAPTSCAAAGKSLYVSLAGSNAVAVIDRETETLRGFIPTGWYPTKVLFSGGSLLVLNGKGVRSRRPNVDGPQPVPERSGPAYVLSLLKGTLSIIPARQITEKLAGWTRQVEEGSPVYSPAEGFKLPIRHIFYIVRENRTYDQVLGDLQQGNGDPFLTLFGEEVTPAAHKLAREFVTLDNFYADGEISVLGHSFTTSGYASPFLEWLGNAQYSGRYKGYPFGIVPAATSPAYLWDALDEKGIDYRIYGENYFLYTRAYRIICDFYGAKSPLGKKFTARMMELAADTDRGNDFYALAKAHYGKADTVKDAQELLGDPAFLQPFSRFLTGDDSLAAAIQKNAPLRLRFAAYLYHYPFNFRSWDLTHSDIERAQEWKSDFDRQVRCGKVARLHYIWLPNDHTAGVARDFLAPDQFVSQNDAALGLVIETIAKSPVWKDSLILVTEDDAQNGPDHVDATRTVALAAGPYVRRNAVVSDRYDQLSMLRTIELILGLPPLNLNDALAVPMLGIFTAKPDDRSYGAPAPSIHLGDRDKLLYQRFRDQ